MFLTQIHHSLQVLFHLYIYMYIKYNNFLKTKYLCIPDEGVTGDQDVFPAAGHHSARERGHGHPWSPQPSQRQLQSQRIPLQRAANEPLTSTCHTYITSQSAR